MGDVTHSFDATLAIHTERLLLRRPHIDDFDAYASLYADEEAARYIGGRLSRVEAWRKFLQMPGAWAVQGFAMFSVVEKVTGRWIGQLGPWRPEGWPGNEIGWSFLRSSWGHGYATEAGVAAMDFAVDRLGWTQMIHCIDQGNVGSQGVARRLGSRVRGSGPLPAPFDDHVVDIWGQSADEWRARRAQR